MTEDADATDDDDEASIVTRIMTPRRNVVATEQRNGKNIDEDDGTFIFHKITQLDDEISCFFVVLIFVYAISSILNKARLL